MSSNNKLEYFASVDQTEITDKLQSLVESYDSYITSTIGLLPLWRTSYNRFYSNIYTNGNMTSTGEQGEYTSVFVNHYANLILHIKNLATSQKVVWDAKATNSDAKSIKQTIVANAVVEYYNKILKLDAKLRQTLENSLLYGEGFIEVAWDTSIGEIYAQTEDDEGNPKTVYSGDCVAYTYTPNDVIRDCTKKDNNADWYILRRRVNRFDLAARYPQLADKLKTGSSVPLENFATDLNIYAFNDYYDNTYCYLYTFYHKRTPACPEGRLTVFTSKDVLLFDGALPYDDIPVMRMVPNERTNSVFGHTPAFDLLPLQQNMDGLYSSIASNQSTFGVNNVLVPRGSDVTNTQLDGGLSLVYYNAQAGKPETLQLCNTPVEIFNHIQTIQNDMQLLSGINSVVRGESPSAAMSGVALNLLQQQATQFSNGLIASYIQCAEDVGTNLINILKSYAKTERIITIAGKNNIENTQTFKSEDISDIQRVTVEVGNPTTQTVAGRVALADNLMQAGLIGAQEYINVLESGQLNDTLSAQEQNILLVKDENEALLEGESCQALISDDHIVHIKEHLTLLASCEARKDPELIQRVLSHVNEHKTLLQTGDPFILSLTQTQQAPQAPGQNPMQPTNPPQMPGMPSSPEIGGAPTMPTGMIG